MALRDIKNDLSLNTGLHAPGGTRKRQMTESEFKTSVPNKMRTLTGGLQLDSFYSLGGQNAENTTNEFLNEQSSSKVETPKQKEPKCSMTPTDGEKETTVSINITQLSPECCSVSELSFFTDPSVIGHYEGNNSAEPSLNCVKKYFSTPMPSNGKPRKKLSPIIEVESEANALREMQNEDKISTINVVHRGTHGVDAPLYESPTHSPLYRSFFANECQEIVKQIECSENDLKSPEKKKAEEFEVSSIDAEPPPYECTPMKSMLACEVANMISSLENSPVIDGASLFGESLLDLDKTDMQFQDFDLSGDKSSKRLSLNCPSVKGFYLEDKLDGMHSPSHKSIRCGELNLSKVLATKNEQVPLTGDSSNMCISTTGNNGEIYPANNTWEVPANATLDIDFLHPVHQVPTTNKTELSTLFPQIVGNTTHDIVTESREVSIVNTTEVIEAATKMSLKTQNGASAHEETTRAGNTTWVMDEVSESCSMRQVFGPENVINTTSEIQIIEVMPQLSNTTQDIVLAQEGENAANTTQVIGVIPQSPNATKDIILTQEEVEAANITQVIGVVPQSANITQDIATRLEKESVGNTTQVMSPQSADIAQDVVLPHENVGAANITLVMGVVPQTADITQNIVSTHDEESATNTTQVMGVLPHTANITCDIVLTHEEVGAANIVQVTGVLPQSADITQVIVSPHKVVTATNAIQVKLHSSANVCEIELPHKAKVIKLVSENKTLDIVSLPKVLGTDIPLNSPDTDMTTDLRNDVLLQASASDDANSGDTPTSKIQSLSLSNAMTHALSKSVAVPHNIATLDDVASAAQVSDLSEETGDKILYLNKVKSIQVSDLANSVTERNHFSVTDSPKTSDHSCMAAKEIVLLDKADKVLASDEDKTPVTVNVALDNLSAPGNTAVALESKLVINEGYNINTCTATASTDCEACPSIERKGHFLMSESCSLIQEEENVHDVSVFSAGSLSFVTSTPVPGLTNFQFQKACKHSEHQDNEYVGFVGPQRKISLDQTTQQEQEEMRSENEDRQKAKVVSMLPTTTKRTMLPPQTSSIPSARRSLALQKSSIQVSAREAMLSKMSPKGVPGRGIIRPPMARQSLLRGAGDGPSGIMPSNKVASRFKKATTEKRSTSTSSQLPPPPLVKPPCQLSTASSGRLSVGVHNATNRLQEPSSGETSGVRPVGTRTGILKPGRLSLRPPLPSNTQKTSPKSNAMKSNLPGLPVKKKEISALGSHKETSTMKGESVAAKKTLKQNLSAQAMNNKISSKTAGKPSASTSRMEQATVESFEKGFLPVEEIPSRQSTLTDATESERCCHLETCKCCQTRYQQLLNEILDLKRQLGQV